MTTLQENPISLHILALSFPRENFPLDTDARNCQVGCVLLQEQPDTANRSTGYWSRSSTKAGPTYDITQQECLHIF